MPKPPIRRGVIKRGTDAEPERISSRIITARLDLRQEGLFELPPDMDRARHSYPREHGSVRPELAS